MTQLDEKCRQLRLRHKTARIQEPKHIVQGEWPNVVFTDEVRFG